MNFLNIFKDRKKVTVFDLIRNHQKNRISRSETAKLMGITTDSVDSFTDEDLLGSPEATIFTIGHSYGQLKEKRIPDDDILTLIEEHRNRSIPGLMPINPSIFRYVHYRTRLEHSEGFPMSDHDILDTLLSACQLFPNIPLPKNARRELASVARPLAPEIRDELIVSGYRYLAAKRGCAPDYTIDDKRILTTWMTTQILFGKEAVKKEEILPQEIANNIALFFLQKFQMLGSENRDFYEQHFVRELQYYRNFGLREEYKEPIRLF